MISNLRRSRNESEKRLQSRTLSESPFDEKKSSKDSIKICIHVSLHEHDGQDETNSDIQDESEKIPSEIFREIYIFFPRSEKQNPSCSDFMRTPTLLYLKKIKKMFDLPLIEFLNARK